MPAISQMNRPRAESSSVQPSHRLSPPFIWSAHLSIEECFLDFIYEGRQNPLEPGYICVRMSTETWAKGPYIFVYLTDCDGVPWPHHWDAGVGREMGTVTEALKGPVSGTLVLSMICAYFPSFFSQRRMGLHIPAQHQRPSSSHSNSSLSSRHSFPPRASKFQPLWCPIYYFYKARSFHEALLVLHIVTWHY